MNTNLQALQSLLQDLSDFGVMAKDQDVNYLDKFDPLLERAHSLGVVTDRPTTLGALRQAVQTACAADDAPAGRHDITAHILGNREGVPGDGP